MESKKKYFQGAEEFFFQGFGEISALFSGIKGALIPLGPYLAQRNVSREVFCRRGSTLGPYI